jgi:hypothetical protein
MNVVARPPQQSIVDTTDRRSFRRAPLDRPVLLENDTKSVTARSINVSGGGIALRTDLALEVGDRMSVYFELPIGYGVQAEAEVLRRDGDFVALRFVEAAHEAILAVRSFCRISGLVPASRRAGP